MPLRKTFEETRLALFGARPCYAASGTAAGSMTGCGDCPHGGAASPGAGEACPAIRVSTDFSGLETPLFALSLLGVPFKHCSSCDNAPAPRLWGHANFAALRRGSAKFFEDVLVRDPKTLPQHTLYVAGFPCTPFSGMHAGTKLLKDVNARQYYAAVRTIAANSPPIAVLENVIGRGLTCFDREVTCVG